MLSATTSVSERERLEKLLALKELATKVSAGAEELGLHTSSRLIGTVVNNVGDAIERARADAEHCVCAPHRTIPPHSRDCPRYDPQQQPRVCDTGFLHCRFCACVTHFTDGYCDVCVDTQ
jgi:hypothetical protein